MLGRLFSARIKTAEQALEAGRLDEAFRTASAPDLAAEPRIQKLLVRIGAALFDRAAKHYEQGRCAEALQDLAKAAQNGGEPQRIRDLVIIVQAAMEEDAARHHDRRQRVAHAAERMAAGSLRGAREILARASGHDHAVQRLREKIDDREARAAAGLQEVQQHLAGRRWSAAAQRLRAVRELNASSEQAASFEKDLVDAVLDQVRGSLEAGHVNRGLEELRLLTGIGEGLASRDEGRLILRQFEAASRAFGQAQYEQARRALLPLRQILPGASWLATMCDQLKDLDELITQVHAGPLGLIFAAPGGAALPAAAAGEPRKVRPASSEAETLDPAAAVAGDIPPQALLWVDGAGSYLLLRGPVSSIGRLASRRPADIPLICDLSEHHADVRRVDGDYFLDVHGETGNAGGPRPVLLHDGDKIILGRRARFVFQLPSRKCSSAVLDLVGSARMPNDVRRVILFDRLLTVGPAPQSHIVVPAASAPVVLFERGGRLWLRLQAESAPDQAVEMVAGRRVELAGLSLVLQPWSRK